MAVSLRKEESWTPKETAGVSTLRKGHVRIQREQSHLARQGETPQEKPNQLTP